MKRREFLAGALALPALMDAARAQDQLDPDVWAITNGAPVKAGKVKLELPQLADNGNSVPMKVSVDRSGGDLARAPRGQPAGDRDRAALRRLVLVRFGAGRGDAVRVPG